MHNRINYEELSTQAHEFSVEWKYDFYWASFCDSLLSKNPYKINIKGNI